MAKIHEYITKLITDHPEKKPMELLDICMQFAVENSEYSFLVIFSYMYLFIYWILFLFLLYFLFLEFHNI